MTTTRRSYSLSLEAVNSKSCTTEVPEPPQLSQMQTRATRKRRANRQMKALLIAAAVAQVRALTTSQHGGAKLKRQRRGNGARYSSSILYSSYEEQYAALSQSFFPEPPHYPLDSSGGEDNDTSPENYPFPAQQEEFLDFISTGSSSAPPPPLSTTIGTIPDITEDDLQFFSDYHAKQKPVTELSYTNFTTTLDFDAFSAPSSMSADYEEYVHKIEEIVGDETFSYEASSPPNAGSTSSYLENLGATSSSWEDVPYYPDADVSSVMSSNDHDANQPTTTEEQPYAVPQSSRPPFKISLAPPSTTVSDDAFGSRAYAFDLILSGRNAPQSQHNHNSAEVLPPLSLDAAQPRPKTKEEESSTSTETITVQVSTLLPPDISIHHAKQAWLDYCWKQGGGIMVPTFGADKKKDDEGHDEIPPTREFLVPWGLKQELVDIPKTDNHKDFTVVGYRTTRRGPFWQDIVPNSHMATVEFVTERQDDYKYRTQVPPTRMIWKVQFDVHVNDANERSTNDAGASVDDDEVHFSGVDFSDFYDARLRYILSKAAFWKAWTKFQLESATKKFLTNLEIPSNLISIDHTEKMPMGISPQQALEAWYEYCWCGGGGGATLIPPVHFQQGRQRWIVPAMLEEEIVSMHYDECCHVIYKVNNPNPFTYPVHYHQGKVRFKRYNANTPTLLLWNVQVRPYRKFMGYGVQFWTKSSMAVASRNLRRHLEEKQEATDSANAVPASAWSELKSKDQGTPLWKTEVSLPQLPNFPANSNNRKHTVAQRATQQLVSSSQSSSTGGFELPKLPSFPKLAPKTQNKQTSPARQATLQLDQLPQPSAKKGFSLPNMPKLPVLPINPAISPSSVERQQTLQVQQPLMSPKTSTSEVPKPKIPGFSKNEADSSSLNKIKSTKGKRSPEQPAPKWIESFSLPRFPGFSDNKRKETSINSNFDVDDLQQKESPKRAFLFPSIPGFAAETAKPWQTYATPIVEKEKTTVRQQQDQKREFSLLAMPDFVANNYNRESVRAKKPLVLRKTLVLHDRLEGRKVFSLPNMPKFSFIEKDGDQTKPVPPSPRRKTLIIDQQQKKLTQGEQGTSVLPFPSWNFFQENLRDNC